MSFLGSLFGGQNKTLNNDMGSIGSNAGFASNLGQGDSSAASSFYRTLLSGNQQQIGSLLAPQIGSLQRQGQQQRQSLSQFGNRSGGTNASMQALPDQIRGNLNDLVSQLTSGAASSLGSMGAGLLSQGTSAYGAQAGLSQQQMDNYKNSFLGQSLEAGGQMAFGAGGKALGLGGF